MLSNAASPSLSHRLSPEPIDASVNHADDHTAPNAAAAADPTHEDTLAELLNNNREWARTMQSSSPGLLARLAQQQTPEILWIGCSDSRVPAEFVCGLGPGELFVHRNIANVVTHTDLSCLSVLQLRNIKDIYTTNREKLSCLPQAEQGNVLVELNVAKSVLNICHTTIVQNAWDRGQDLSVHGWVYNLEDGLIQDLSLCVNRKNEVDDIYAYVTAEAVKPAKRELSKTRTRRSSFLVEKSVTLVPDAVTVNGGVTVSVE
ncbi:hypothetical protein HDU82_004880 [Entophlyctis luteolus]|nr:hypothetical protein HDU82_004880 [Entophlyctis luteolus]